MSDVRGDFHHIGLTVPDIDVATRFFIDVLGFEKTFALPPSGPVDASYAAAVGIPVGSAAQGLTVLRKGTYRLELFQYAASGRRTEFPANHDVGGYHVAFEVDDIEAAIARLVAAGGRVGGPVRTAQAPQFRNMQWAYVVAPFGLQLELVHFPDGSF